MSAGEAPAPDAEEALPAGAGASPVPADWLIEFERQQAARNLTRLMGDVVLLEAIQAAGFAGRDYDLVEQQLIKYGSGVLGGWCGRGVIFAKIAEKYGWILAHPPEGAFVGEAIEGVVLETVAIAIVKFREVLRQGMWDPRKGASLNTYFVGQCLIRFPAVYRRWLREEAYASGMSMAGSGLDLELLGQLSTQVTSPEQMVVKKAEVDEALSRIPDPRVRTALIMKNDGFTQAEIATHLDTTEKAVERMLANSRNRIRHGKAAE